MQTNKTFLLILLIGCFLSSPQLVSGQNTSLAWATYFGGPDNDYGKAIATDTAGNIYITGITNSVSGIASTGALQTVFGGGATNSGDAFVAKFTPSGSLLWATYFGGSNNEQGLALATDNSGNVYLAGYSSSTVGIATVGAYQSTQGGSDDAFIAKFSSSGSLVWASYYGGTGMDRAYAVTVDTANNVYLAGSTRSSSGIATTGGHQTTISSTGSDEGFIVKFDSTGSRLWATYYGGNGGDIIRSLAVDAANNIVMAGQTTSASTTGIASTGAWQSTYGGSNNDGFIARFSASGQRLWGTYYGGNLADQLYAVNCDDSGHIYVSGNTKSAAMATLNAYQATFGGGVSDGLLSQFDTLGQLIWSTYYGGSFTDNAVAAIPDNNGHVYLYGQTVSTQGIATPGVINDTLQFRDAYVAKFTTGGGLLWGTYVGGSDDEVPQAMDYFSGNIYLTGQSNSVANFTTPGSYQSTLNGNINYDGFLAKINDCPALISPSAIVGNSFICPGDTVVFSVAPVAAAQSYTWTLPSGWAGSSSTDSIMVVAASGLNDTIFVSANYVCGTSAPVALAVTVSAPAAVMALGNLAICSGDSVTLLANTESVTSWQWLHNGQVIANATDSMLSVQQAGNYTVVTVTNNLCTDTSVADTVIVHSLPQPVISMSGNTLSTGSYITYQWYHNGAAITGATNQTYTMIAITGSYAVEVTDTNGCKAMSADYIPTSIASMNVHPEIRIYPNPVTDVLVIDAPYKVAVTIRSIDGKTLQQLYDVKDVDMSRYASGLYFVRLTNEAGVMICERKLVKE